MNPDRPEHLVIIGRERRQPASSWWLDRPREGFTRYVETEHLARMRGTTCLDGKPAKPPKDVKQDE